MTLQQCYNIIKGDIEEVRTRLKKDDRIIKYLLLFSSSSDFQNFFSAIESEDWKNAYVNAHNIKGMSLNLSIKGLSEISSEICEAIRHGEPENDISCLKERFSSEYTNVMNTIKKLSD